MYCEAYKLSKLEYMKTMTQKARKNKPKYSVVKFLYYMRNDIILIQVRL